VDLRPIVPHRCSVGLGINFASTTNENSEKKNQRKIPPLEQWVEVEIRSEIELGS
jgi:hypothetical protein